MGQIKVEKNAGGIEGLCANPNRQFTEMPEDISWRLTIREIWKKKD